LVNNLYMNKNDFVLGSQTTLPSAVRDWAESLKDRAGVYATCYQGKPVYLVAAGERPSGGYSVALSGAPTEAGVLLYRITEPSAEDFVIQVITYPYELVFSLRGKSFRFRLVEQGQESESRILGTPPLVG